MPFTVGDFRDLLRLLDEQPEWRAELRRHVLSEDLLALPSIVGALAEAQVRTEQRVAELAAAQAGLAHRMDQLIERMDELTQRMDELTQRMDELVQRMDELTQRMDELAVGLARMDARAARLEDRVGTIEGDVLELRYAQRAPAYFSRLARRLRVVEPGVLADLLDDAVEEGRLAETERAAVLLADLVLTGRRRDDGADVYLVAEISAGVGTGDVKRARDRAEILAKLGRQTVPVVAGRRIDPDAEAMARADGVSLVLNGRASVPGEG